MTAAELVKALCGKWHGSYGTARCPAHNDRRPSLSITECSGKLLVCCHANCDQQAVWRALRDRGLLPEREGGYRRRFAPARPAASQAVDPEAEAKAAFAKRIWDESRVAVGTPVQRYLEGRGLTIEPPPTIRYHPGLKHGPTGLPLPAMVAAVTMWPVREVVAIHRTFLVADGRKKAPVSQNKMMLGRCAGGAVRFAPAGKVLILAEGIETALSVQAATGLPAWAALSAGGIEGVLLPDLPLAGEIILAADHDDAGLRAANTAAEKWARQGRTVRIAVPPQPGTDFNDMATEEATAIIEEIVA
jgi:hypothetical protein